MFVYLHCFSFESGKTVQSQWNERTYFFEEKVNKVAEAKEQIEKSWCPDFSALCKRKQNALCSILNTTKLQLQAKKASKNSKNTRSNITVKKL